MRKKKILSCLLAMALVVSSLFFGKTAKLNAATEPYFESYDNTNKPVFCQNCERSFDINDVTFVEINDSDRLGHYAKCPDCGGETMIRKANDDSWDFFHHLAEDCNYTCNLYQSNLPATNIDPSGFMNAVSGELVNPTAPASKVSGIVSAAKIKIYHSLTPGEQAALNSGSTIDLKIMSTYLSDANVPTADKNQIETVKGNLTIGMYMDLSLFVKVGSEAEREFSEPDGAVTVTVDVPTELINDNAAYTRVFKVLHYHYGDAPEVLNATFDPVAKSITFHTTRFSTFAIAYTDVLASQNNANVPGNQIKDEVPKTGEMGNLSFYAGLILVALFGAVIVVRKKNK